MLNGFELCCNEQRYNDESSTVFMYFVLVTFLFVLPILWLCEIRVLRYDILQMMRRQRNSLLIDSEDGMGQETGD